MKIDKIHLDPRKHIIEFDLKDFEYIIPLVIKNEKGETIKFGFKDRDKDRAIMIELPSEKIKELKELL